MKVNFIFVFEPTNSPISYLFCKLPILMTQRKCLEKMFKSLENKVEKANKKCFFCAVKFLYQTLGRTYQTFEQTSQSFERTSQTFV